MKQPVLAVKAHLQRGEFELTVDCQLPLWGVTALFGRSGCGKTTLLRIIAGLERAAGASVQFAGQSWQQGRQFVALHQRRVGLVFQETSLLAHLSVKDNLLYGYQRTLPVLRRHSLQEVSAMLDIDALLTRPVTKLSGGQRQRVALGRALLSSPQLLLLDEPLAALDSQSKAEIMPFLLRLAQQSGVPMLLVSHQAAEVEKLADRVVFMQQGQISSIESLSQALARADSPLFSDSGAAVVLQGEVGEPDPHGRYPFGPANARFWLSSSVASGRNHRLRVQARDVSLALTVPGMLSIQNQLAATIEQLAPFNQQLLVSLRLADGQLLLAEITRYAAQQLALLPGQQVTALVKSVALLD